MPDVACVRRPARAPLRGDPARRGPGRRRGAPRSPHLPARRPDAESRPRRHGVRRRDALAVPRRRIPRRGAPDSRQGPRASWSKAKLPLRAILRGRIPDSVIHRKKHGFAIPLARSLRSGRLAPLARELLNDVTAPFAGVLRGDSARDIYDAFLRGAEIEPLVYACLVVALHATIFGQRARSSR